MFCFSCPKCCTGRSDNELPPSKVVAPTPDTAKGINPLPVSTRPAVIKPKNTTTEHSQRSETGDPSHRSRSTKMPPSMQVETPPNPLSPGAGGHWRRISGGLHDYDSVSNGAARSVLSRRISRKTATAGESSNISNVVYSLKRSSGDELGNTTASKLLNANHATVLDWIRHQRMSKIPPEGSSYDKVLAWAQLFIERLHSFDLAIENFAGDSYLAAQLAYGYCMILLEVR